MTRWMQALLLSPFVRHKLRPLATKERKKDLQFLKELIEAGKVRADHRQDVPIERGP